MGQVRAPFTPATWNWRVNVTDWWVDLVPPHAPHHVLLMAALLRLAAFMHRMADVAAFLLAHLMSAPEREPCEELGRRLYLAKGAYEDLGIWATDLESEDVGMLSIGGGPAKGPCGVVQSWVSEVGRLFYAQPWGAEVSCERRSLDLPRIWRMIDAVLAGAGALQQTWPWLVDSAAVASAALVALTAPSETRDSLSDADVLRTLLGHSQAAAPLVVEVGVDEGRTSAHLLEVLPGLRLVGVDPYSGAYGGVPSSGRVDGMGASVRYDRAAGRFARFGSRAELWRTPSLVAARNWAGGPIDLVFIDGEHDFASCKEDTSAWAAHVRPGGIVAGDDYRWAVPGVWRAVHALVPQGVRLHVAPGGVWWWVKPVAPE